MAAITAAMVKELRESTGAGMMECKKALVEAEGDMDKAVDVLRTRGIASVAKKSGRATNEGTIMVLASDDAKRACALELNCETDFVGMNDTFKGYARRIAQVALDNDLSCVDALMEASASDGVKVPDIIADCIHVLGENTSVKRVCTVDADAVATYIHMGGKIGVIVCFKTEGIDAAGAGFTELGHNVAMQVAAIAPVSVDRDAVPADVAEHELGIYKAQAAESGKPENIQEKIALGRMEKFYKENCLTEMAYVKDPDLTVGAYIAKAAKELGGTVKAVDFVRFALGE